MPWVQKSVRLSFRFLPRLDRKSIRFCPGTRCLPPVNGAETTLRTRCVNGFRHIILQRSLYTFVQPIVQTCTTGCTNVYRILGLYLVCFRNKGGFVGDAEEAWKAPAGTGHGTVGHAAGRGKVLRPKPGRIHEKRLVRQSRTSPNGFIKNRFLSGCGQRLVCRLPKGKCRGGYFLRSSASDSRSAAIFSSESFCF